MEALSLTTIQLDRDTECVRCNLHEECRTRCIPTTLNGSERRHLSKRAVLIVGAAPGGNEDDKNQPFVGPSGHVLRKLYIDFFELEKKADVYLTYAARCYPPGKRTPNKTQLKACHVFLLADVVRLQQEYDEVLVLAVGGPAVRAVWGLSLKKSFIKQGEFTDWHNLVADPDPVPEPTRVFVTYDPSYLRQEPSSGLSVKRHLQMLSDYLDGTLEYELPDLLDIGVSPLPPKYVLRRLSLDIETYGIVKGHPKQRFFHPKLSIRRDFAGLNSLVQTCGLTWRAPGPLRCDCDGRKFRARGQLMHCIFDMQNVTHRRRLWAWIKKCRDEDGFEWLLGQNVVFDLMYLRHCYKEARILLEDPLPILDLMILNYLHDEGRPEKSLKALAPLFRVSKYGETRINGEYKRYDTNQSTELHQYNCQDTASTLRIAEKLMDEIVGFYGKDTKKLSPFCMQWYSQLLWLIVWMQENGLRMDKPQLDILFNRNETALNAIMRTAREKFNMPLRGKGSELGKRKMMDDAVQYLTTWEHEIPELEMTDKTGEFRFSVDNRNALMDCLDHRTSHYKQLKLFGAYQDVSGIMDRYLYPLLVGGGKKHDNMASVLLDGFCYPRWFPVPSEFEDSSTGGTKQARIVAKGPPCQTFPPPVKKCIIGRYPRGWMVWFDYSQIELRVAALLSNDPPLMQAYMDGLDLHRNTALLMFGDDIETDPNFGSKYRQAGKTFNFRALYRGGVKIAQRSLMKDLGISLSEGNIATIDGNFWKKHHVLRKWQDHLMEFVRHRGFYELPLIGQSRLFLGGKKSQERKLNEIVNLPVQAIAADIMLSAQYALWSRFRREGLKAVIPCNVYDAALIECPKFEIHRVTRIMDDILPNPPFYQALCAELGRTLPLEYEVKKTRMTA